MKLLSVANLMDTEKSEGNFMENNMRDLKFIISSIKDIYMNPVKYAKDFYNLASVDMRKDVLIPYEDFTLDNPPNY